MKYFALAFSALGMAALCHLVGPSDRREAVTRPPQPAPGEDNHPVNSPIAGRFPGPNAPLEVQAVAERVRKERQEEERIKFDMTDGFVEHERNLPRTDPMPVLRWRLRELWLRYGNRQCPGCNAFLKDQARCPFCHIDVVSALLKRRNTRGPR